MIDHSQEAIYESFETLSQADEYYRWIASRLRPHLKGKVLEMGAGSGNFSRSAREWAIEYHVSEGDPRLVAMLEKEFEHVFRWDVYDPFPAADLYDSVITINVVEHLKDDLHAVKAMTERLKPGGCLVILVPAMQFLYGSMDRSFGHFRRYTKQSMKDLIKDVPLTIEKMEYVNVIGMAGWFLYGKILKRENLPPHLCSRFNLVVPLLKLERPLAHFMGLSLITIARK